MAGLTPRADETIELHPIPNEWNHFAFIDLAYHGHALTIVWDKPDGQDQFEDGLEG